MKRILFYLGVLAILGLIIIYEVKYPPNSSFRKTIESKPETGQQVSNADQKAYELYLRVRELEGQGRYSEAIPVVEEWIRVIEEAYGPEHIDVASGLFRLAQLYGSLNDRDKAEKLCEKSIEIAEKNGDDQFVSQVLIEMGLLYIIRGDDFRLSNPNITFQENEYYDKAKSLLDRSFSIIRDTVGEEHPNALACMRLLGSLYYKKGDYGKAESMYNRCLELNEKIKGPNNTGYASLLNSLGMVYQSAGDTEKAEKFYGKSLKMTGLLLGERHPFLVNILKNLSVLYESQGKLDYALYQMEVALESEAYGIKSALGLSSEKQRLSYLLGNRLRTLHQYLGLVNCLQKEKPDVVNQGLDFWLAWKGHLLDSLINSENKGESVKAEEIEKELKTIREELTNLTFAGKKDTERIAGLETAKERLEAKLYQLRGMFSQKTRIKSDHRKVAEMLPPNGILLDFAKIEMIEVGKDGWLPEHYFVFVLRPEGRARMVDLGAAEEMDAAVKLLKGLISGGVNTGRDRAVRPVAKPPKEETDELLEASGRLYNLVIEPIEEELEGVDIIYISPDGNLNLVPFEVITDPTGRYLIEKHAFNYLAASRNILDFGGKEKPETNVSVIMGDPDYESAMTGNDDEAETPNPESEENELRVSREATMRSFQFDRLPGTKAEAESIQSILGESETQIFTGKDAREENLMNLESPRFLHIATHCFFMGDQDSGPNAVGENLEGVMTNRAPSWGEFENPLLRSGIVLAGANESLASGMRADGIVTAEKILHLDLHGTEMAVLSGCDTGLGEIKAGEGVFGLRRAFIRAGARSIVMSMWQVPDLETKELMAAFYWNIVENKTDRCQALRDATLAQMDIVKNRHGNSNPYFWGAFVFMGKP